MADSSDVETLQAALECAYLFRENHQGGKQHQQPTFEDPEVLSLRGVNYLQISLKWLTLKSKKFNDKPITIHSRIPMIRNQSIEYIENSVYDIGTTQKGFLFQNLIKSNFAITENLMGQISQCFIRFQVTNIDVEIGKAEFALQTMILDQVKKFTYKIPVVQTLQAKNKNIKDVIVGELEFEIQLQDELKQGGVPMIQKEIDVEEQSEKIKEQILRQIQEQKEERQRLKQIQEEKDHQYLLQQIKTLQMHLNLQRLVHIFRDNCLQQIGDDQINLFFKLKSYGSQEIHQSEIYWNVFKLQMNYTITVPVTIESLEKMEHFPWIIELWAKNSTSNLDALIGVARLQLNTINNTIMNHSPLQSIQFLKGNLYPQTIYDQDIPFENLRSKQVMTVIRLKLSFGTTVQINRLINQEQEQQQQQQQQQQPSIIQEDEEEEKPITIINEPEQIPESPIEFIKTPLQESIINVLNGISTSLRILPRAQYILKDEFIEITTQLCGLQSNNLGNEFKSLSLYLQCDEQSMDWQIFQNSWQSFTNYKNQLKDIYTKIYAHFYEQAMKIFDSINAMERALPHGQLYLLDQYELRDNLLLLKGGNSPSGPSFSAITINQVLDTLELNHQNQIQITQLLDYMRQFELHGEIRTLHAPIQQLAKIVDKNITQWAKDNKQNIEQFLSNREFQQSLKYNDLISIFQQLDLNITLLDAIIIMYLIGDYANLEQQDGENICAEIAFWRYITYLQDTPLQQPPSPIKPTQPKEPGIKRPKPIDYQFCISTITLEILSLSQLQGKFNLQLHLEDTDLKCLIPESNSNYNKYKIIFTLVDKYNNNSLKQLLDQHLQQSGLNIIIQQEQSLARGNIAIEEILQIPELNFEEFFIPIYDEVTYNEISLMECRISIKQQVVDEQVQENVQVYNQNGIIDIPQQVLSMEQVIEKLKPETLHIFRITVKSIRWFKKYLFESLKFRVSLATEKKILKHAIPQFISDSINKDFDIVVEYQIKCDSVLAAQISKCHLLLELLLIPEKTLIGYLPIKQLIENKEIEGELPMDDSQSGAFHCTLNINTQYSTEEKAPIIEQTEDLKVNRRIILRVTEFVLLDYEMELGEIYFMLVDPFNQSESYSLIANNPSITNTKDCIFLLQDYELMGDIVELQVRSIYLGEDSIVGSVRIQLNQMHQCSIYSESNYLCLDTREQASIASRVAIQLIYVCTPETNNSNFLKAFTYPAIKDLETADLKNYLRNELQFSYSEISLITSLLQGDVFQTKIFEDIQIDAQGNNNLILDLLKEFQFYDANLERFVDPKYLNTIFGYFGINCSNMDMFIPSRNKRKPIDYEAPINQFDYLTYLVHLQKTLKQMRPLFSTNLNGPIQHEIQSAIKQKPKPKTASPVKIQKLHFEIISAHNLNQLQNRIPNAILKLPQLELESRVYYSQSNPEFNSLISLEANQLECLQIQILDKRYNASNEQSIYSNQLIGMVEIPLLDLISKQFPYVFQVFFNENNTSKPAYIKLRVWSDNEEISPVTQPLPKANPNPIPKKTPKKEIDTVRRLVDFFDKTENDPEQSNKQDQTNAKTMKDLTNKIDQIIQALNQQDNQDDEPRGQPPQFQPKQPEQPGQPKKPYFYSSSGSSSQPQQGGKSSDSGNKLDKIQERLPIAADKLKRIEQILRQNNLPIKVVDNNQSDSDDYE